MVAWSDQGLRIHGGLRNEFCIFFFILLVLERIYNFAQGRALPSLVRGGVVFHGRGLNRGTRCVMGRQQNFLDSMAAHCLSYAA